MEIRPARASDLASVEALLREAALPWEDVAPHFGAFLVGERGGALMASAGFEHYGADSVVHFEALTHNALIGWQRAFGFHIQPNGCALGIRGLNNTADDLTHLTLKVLHLIRTFGFTDALLDHLTGGLCCNATKVTRCGFNNHHIAKLRFGIHLAGFIQKHFGLGLHHIFHHFLLGVDEDFTCIGIYFGFHMLGSGRVDSPPIGRDHRGFNRANDHFLGELFLFQYFIES
jgi:hypothetical protein